MSRLRPVLYATLRAASGPWRRVGRWGAPRFRILAYHDVPDPDLFAAHMSHLATHYQVVKGPHFPRNGDEKPPVWVTFDDGDPSIVDNALGVLVSHGLSATAFICPSVVGTEEALWWHVVQEAVEAELVIGGQRVLPGEVRRLKLVPDAQRRERVAEIREALLELRGSLVHRQLTEKELSSWIDAGLTMGNHTWDHPILDQCPPVEQRRQIDLAHDWFLENGYRAPKWFAYPNGNWSAFAEQHLSELGYEAALLFDHRAAKASDGRCLSRIRVNGTDSLNEFIPKVAGIHPAVTRWRV